MTDTDKEYKAWLAGIKKGDKVLVCYPSSEQIAMGIVDKISRGKIYIGNTAYYLDSGQEQQQGRWASRMPRYLQPISRQDLIDQHNESVKRSKLICQLEIQTDWAKLPTKKLEQIVKILEELS